MQIRVIYGLSILIAVSACATARIIDADHESPGGAVQLMRHASDIGKLVVPTGALSLIRGNLGVITVTRVHAKTIRLGQIPVAVAARNTAEFSAVSLVR